MDKNEILIQELIRELSSATNIGEQDAIATEFCLDGLPEGIASIARACVLFHWFDQTVIEALSQLSLTRHLETAQVYEQIQKLPFVETLPWGSSCFQDLTREGLLQRYARTKKEFLQQVAELAISAYEKQYQKQQNNKKVAAELLFCLIIAGEQEASRKLLCTLQEQAYTRRDWRYLGDLLDRQKEAERFSFVHPLPVDADSWFFRGLVSHARGELEQAISDYEQTIVLDPNNARVNVHCGTAYAERGQTDRAHALYNRALLRAPDLVEALVARGRFLLRLGNYAAALKDFNAAIQQHGEDPALHYAKGVILSKQEKYAEALIAFDASLKLDPYNPVSSRGKEAALAGLRQKEEVSTYSTSVAAQENPLHQHYVYRFPGSGSFEGPLPLPAPPKSIRTNQDRRSQVSHYQVPPMRTRNRLPQGVGWGVVVAAVIIGALFLFRIGRDNVIANNATATAIAKNNATATAIAKNSATATAIAKNTNPYENWGDMIFNDPLTEPDNWLPRTNDSSNGYCQFKNDGYHVRETATHSLYVCASKTEVLYSNFLFEARVILSKGGCGGIVSYYNPNVGSGYVFFVCSDGSYRLSQYSDSNNSVILQTGNTNVNSGENSLAVGTVSDQLTVYLNNKELLHISASGNGLSGYIGFLADDRSNNTENIYTNASLRAFLPSHGGS